MKTKIIEQLRAVPNQTAGQLVTSTGEKRGSVSKCLTRLVRKGEVHYRRNGSWLEYFLPPATTPSPANSEATATANA